MSSINFESIFKNGMWSVDGGALSASMTRKIAQAELTAKVPELCPDCHGDPSWLRDGAHGNLEPCDHPNAPTIAKLLAIGAAVIAAKSRDFYGDDYDDGWNDCLDALRLVTS